MTAKQPGRGPQESGLDRRRRKFQKARSSADGADAAFRQLDEKVGSNAEQTRRFESDLRAAQDRIAALKRAIKESAKDATKLRGQRDAARQRAAAAHERSARAEDRYGAAVLSDLLRREKDTDLAAHPATRKNGRRGSDVHGSQNGSDAGPDGAPAEHDTPGDDAPDRSTARRTAARRTAARAEATTTKPPRAAAAT